MRVVSFDAFRSLDIPGVHYLKPELYLKNLPMLTSADWLLFPDYWQICGLHFGLKARLFPSLASYMVGHDKIEQTRVFQLLFPRHTPNTQILANTAENAALLWDEMTLPFVAKIPRSSEGRGVFLIEERVQWRLYQQQTPVLYVQEYLPIDRDLRLVVIGNRVVAGYWRLQSANGFHNNIACGGELDFSPVPKAAVELVESLSTRLGIDHGGFDLAMLGDQPMLIEYNRLFGNNGLIQQGIRTGSLIYQYLLEQSEPERTPPASDNHPWLSRSA